MLLKLERTILLLTLPALLLAALPLLASSQEKKYDEYQVKAAFIYNFPKFIAWPEATPAGGALPKALCIIGDDPFGANLEGIPEADVPGNELTVTHVRSLTDIRGCRILYVSSSEKGRLKQIIEACAGFPVLIVADTEGWARFGVMINFYLEEEMVRFEINNEALRRAGLNASAKLLKISRIVR
jgi:hypothetical protein